jgi:hypothetical protein
LKEKKKRLNWTSKDDILATEPKKVYSKGEDVFSDIETPRNGLTSELKESKKIQPNGKKVATPDKTAPKKKALKPVKKQENTV